MCNCGSAPMFCKHKVSTEQRFLNLSTVNTWARSFFVAEVCPAMVRCLVKSLASVH